METLPRFCGSERNCIARGLPPKLSTSDVVDEVFVTEVK